MLDDEVYSVWLRNCGRFLLTKCLPYLGKESTAYFLGVNSSSYYSSSSTYSSSFSCGNPLRVTESIVVGSGGYTYYGLIKEHDAIDS